jgi:hypothetical protein
MRPRFPKTITSRSSITWGAVDVNLFQSAIDQAGGLLISIPSALLILISREWYTGKMTGNKEVNPAGEFSLFSFACLVLTGTAPGGLLRDQPFALLRFLHGQLWLVILLALGVLYALIKDPQPDSFSARFSATFLMQVWAVFVINFIPLPPFDAAATYFSPYMQWKMFTALVALLNMALMVTLIYPFWRLDFLTGKFLVQWLRLA